MLSRLISNFDTLAVTPARIKALEILEAGLEAIKTKTALKKMVALHDETLFIGKTSYQLNKFKNIFVVAIGKAANEAAAALEDILGDRIASGIALDIRPGQFKKVTSLVGSHPLPSEQNVAAAKQVTSLLKNAGSKDLIIAVVSGGGSALLCLPHSIDWKKMAEISAALMKHGADIRELNIVRKHLSDISGGSLARLAAPATLISLIFSDIPNNDLSLVASGPTYLDSSTVGDAKKILEKHELDEPDVLRALRETPKDPEIFEKVRNFLVVSSAVASQAMSSKAREFRLRPRIVNGSLTGEARQVGKMLAEQARPGEAVIAAGETTVKVSGRGDGGRNQELALGALRKIGPEGLVLSCASDGWDNSPLAGAIADSISKNKAAELKLDPAAYLADNNSLVFWQLVGSGIKMKNPGSNVSDLMLSIF